MKSPSEDTLEILPGLQVTRRGDCVEFRWGGGLVIAEYSSDQVRALARILQAWLGRARAKPRPRMSPKKGTAPSRKVSVEDIREWLADFDEAG
jgi:hypothetical protein